MITKPILLVDDEPINLMALQDILSEQYPLVFARSGKDALAAVLKHQPSMVLLDINMPDMSGYEVCRKLKQHPATAEIPVIFVTALADVENEKTGFEVGGVDYIIKPLSPPVVLARVKTHLSLVQVSKLEKSYKDAIYMLGSAGHYNDTDTGVHIWRMAAYAGELACASGWTKEDGHLLEMAAPMHDTGKIGIPESVLRKPAKLNAEEWVIMKNHTCIGYEILSQSDAPVFKLAAEIALRHHEKWDGSGYPDGLAGNDIPESARIVALADVFDALTMKRPYKEAWPLEKALDNILDASGSHFEPRLVTIFESILPRILAIKESWNNKQ